MKPRQETAALPALATHRLALRPLTADDAAFILELVTDPSWLRYIGDKSVHNLDDARRYIENGPRAMYGRHGFGLYLVALKDGGVPIGICGLIRRDTLEDVDLGFAFLPRYRSRGYAFESAHAKLAYGHAVLGLERIVAIASPDNLASTRLLGKLGFEFERMIRTTADPDADAVALYAHHAPATAEGRGTGSPLR